MKVLVVDDEQPARTRLQQLLDDLDGYECVGEAGNGRVAIERVAETGADIVLLDIRMPELDGIETAHHLNALEHPPAVVFTTAYDEYAVDAFEARAIGYVLKPVRRAKLAAALEQAARLAGPQLKEIASGSGMATARKHVCARVQDQMFLIPVPSIRYFQADQKYIAVHHDDGLHLIDESLISLEEEFGDSFVRISRSALVAVASIDTLEKADSGGMQIVLRDSPASDKALIISRRHLAEVRRRLKGA